MKDLLVRVERELTEEEQRYRDLFINLLSNMVGYLFQEGEKITQCLDHRDGERYYNPSWFESNMGYLFSVARNRIKIMKPSIKSGGKRKARAEREWTEYLRHTCPGWERQSGKGYTPQYYFYKNNYPLKHGLSDTVMPVRMERIVAMYHLPETEKIKLLDPRYDVHHKINFDWNRPAQCSNCADNLQVLLEVPHTDVNKHPEERQHTYTHNVGDVRPEKIQAKADDPGALHVALASPGSLEKWFLAGLRYTAQQNPDTPLAVAEKDAEGRQYRNSYHTVSSVEETDL